MSNISLRAKQIVFQSKAQLFALSIHRGLIAAASFMWYPMRKLLDYIPGHTYVITKLDAHYSRIENEKRECLQTFEKLSKFWKVREESNTSNNADAFTNLLVERDMLRAAIIDLLFFTTKNINDPVQKNKLIDAGWRACSLSKANRS